MDEWGFHQLRPWLERRLEMPVGTLFCVIDGQTRGRHWTPAAARNHLRRVASKAGIRYRDSNPGFRTEESDHGGQFGPIWARLGSFR
jgi:hypothetical protein